MTLVLLCGPVFSGKTTLALALERRRFARVSLDEILRRWGHEPGSGLPAELWEEASATACDQIQLHADHGRDIVLDDTLCFQFLRARYRGLAKRLGMEARLVVLTIAQQDVIERYRLNESELSRPTIERQVLLNHLASFEWPGQDELPTCVDATTSIQQQLARLTEAGIIAVAG